MIDVEQYLQSHQIKYVRHEHPAIFTCADAEKYYPDVPGIPGKNLFIKNKNHQRFFLFSLPAAKRADFKALAKIVGESKLSFASSESLKEKLGLEPGSVSPFGLLNDSEHQVEVYIDQDIYQAEIVNFHPNRNTASLELTKEMFHKYLETLEHNIKII